MKRTTTGLGELSDSKGSVVRRDRLKGDIRVPDVIAGPRDNNAVFSLP